MDDDKSRWNGKGMLNAIKNINELITPAIMGMDAYDQRQIDETMVTLDGTPNKAKLGGNAILAVSIAVANAAA